MMEVEKYDARPCLPPCEPTAIACLPPVTALRKTSIPLRPDRPFMREDRGDNVRSGKPFLPIPRPAAALCGLGQRGCPGDPSDSWWARSLPQLGPDRPFVAAAFPCAGS